MADNNFVGNEEDDTVSPLCSCGHMSKERTGKFATSNNHTSCKKKNSWLDSSFVHLMTPKSSGQAKINELSHQQFYQQQQYSNGLLTEHLRTLQLLHAALGGDVELCADCIDIVSAALENDTQRLYTEVQVYEDTIQAAQQRFKSLRNMSVTNHYHMDISATEEAYQQEIEMLKRELEGREDELSHLKSLYKEQVAIARHLNHEEEQLHSDRNSLELQSQAFENRRDLLTKTLAETQEEVDRLSLVSIPRSLFDLQVDPRGLRYPLINQLRLAFQPKGDVPAEEVRVAWAQATQLLLFVGTLFDYPGVDWKLVPLADCAKLIYRKEIFNLSPGDCRSLMAWNALLDQVSRHAMATSKSAIVARVDVKRQEAIASTTNGISSPPFTSSPTSIGDTELARLDPSDHFGWSQVIHRMASNLLWLSEKASDLAATQVTCIAHCSV